MPYKPYNDKELIEAVSIWITDPFSSFKKLQGTYGVQRRYLYRFIHILCLNIKTNTLTELQTKIKSKIISENLLKKLSNTIKLNKPGRPTYLLTGKEDIFVATSEMEGDHSKPIFIIVLSQNLDERVADILNNKRGGQQVMRILKLSTPVS